jgi:DNA-directed RNA polymerase subunit beta
MMQQQDGILRFGRYPAVDVPPLTRLQREAWERFLQRDVPASRRKNTGLEAILRETFPIYSYDRSVCVEYAGYEIGQPRYTPDECRLLGLTYGAPLKVRLRLSRGGAPVEQDVYLGDIPLMLGGGTFIVNGAERCLVAQLHRSPGVDFSETRMGDRRVHKCSIVPERGSWMDLEVNPRKDVLNARIDQGGKMPATLFLRAMSPAYSTTQAILKAFHTVREEAVGDVAESDIVGKPLAGEVRDANGEVLFAFGEPIPKGFLSRCKEAGVERFAWVEDAEDRLIVQTLIEEQKELRDRNLQQTHEDALMALYMRQRPGTPPSLERARTLFHDRFFDPQRYRLGSVGRFRLNRKLGLEIPEDEMTLRAEDIVHCMRYILKLRAGQGHVDDIDHLGNRRVRMIDELAGEEIRKGFLKLKKSIQERLNMAQDQQVEPKTLVNSKAVSSSIEFFFARSDLSQVVDQTNPLSQMTHERRLSALGPGGLHRKRAGYEVRDVHISHYGRICPIETPEGANIGLISSLAIHADLDRHGFITAPFRRVRDGRVTEEIVYLRADEELEAVIAPADTPVDPRGRIMGERALVRAGGEMTHVEPGRVQYMDVSPFQILSVSAGLVPFLEHDDANRALMGSNMQRQAVPLVRPEPPIVGTGLERVVASWSDMAVTAPADGVVTGVSSDRIELDGRPIPLVKFRALNEGTCNNQRPLVRPGDRVKRGQVIADGPAMRNGELALGRNVLVAFMPWEGYNFEDAIVVSERLVHEDFFTSIHIEEFEVEVRETRLGKEELTREIPNVSERALRHLGEDGIVIPGTRVRAGDILVGKVAPKSRTEQTPEEKLLYVIFGRSGDDVKNVSLEVPPDVEGVVIGTRRFSRRGTMTPQEKRKFNEEKRRLEREAYREMNRRIQEAMTELKSVLGRAPVRNFEYGPKGSVKTLLDLKAHLNPDRWGLRGARQKEEAERIVRDVLQDIERMQNECEKRMLTLQRGDELPAGVLEMVKVWVAAKRYLMVGDKMAGRHGNKGVIARILPVEDMPYLEDGTPVDVVLNPLGVPSRMNVGQIFEAHLGWAMQRLGLRAICPPFDGASEREIEDLLEKAGLPRDGKVTLYDGRTGEPFADKVTVGVMYLMKLHHLVADKIHARATGRYSLITAQPLGGKARRGGQRLGEMEVWALEAYGAANLLQELLTVKSDDIDGRGKIYDAMVKGTNVLEPGTPVSFEVLCSEIRGLGLSLRIERSAELS